MSSGATTIEQVGQGHARRASPNGPSRQGRGRRVGQRFARSLGFVVLCSLAASTIYPILFVIFTAFKTERDYRGDNVGPPLDATLENVRAAWDQAAIGEFAIHSLIVVSISVLVIVSLAALAGFAFAHLRFPLQRGSLVLVIAMMMLPASILMVPLFRTVQQVGLLNEYLGLVLVYASLNLPFSIYLMTSYYRAIPRELLQAAEVDGASTLRSFATIALPLVRPGILTLVTLNFLWLWNELLFALLILQDPSKRTLTTGLALLNGEHATSVPLISAGLMLSLVPPLLVFAFFQRNLAEGMTAGAVK